MASTSPDVAETLKQILTSLQTIKQDHAHLASAVDAISGRVNVLSGVKEALDAAPKATAATTATAKQAPTSPPQADAKAPEDASTATWSQNGSAGANRRTSTSTSKITLTSYPGQAGVDSIPLNWGHADPSTRGPVVVSRNQHTIGRRNGKLTYPAMSFAFY